MQGIYKIENVKSKKVYVGSSKDIDKRFYQHKRELSNGTHHSIKLQRAWNLTKNKDNFVFSVLEIVDDISQLHNREQYYIDLYDAYNQGYNCSAKVDNPKYARKKLVKKTKENNVPRLHEEFLNLYDKDRMTFKSWNTRKLLEGRYSCDTYNIILSCIKWFLTYYPETHYHLYIMKTLKLNYSSICFWIEYNKQEFVAFYYVNGKIILGYEDTEWAFNYIKNHGLYDENIHQIRGVDN